MAPRTLLATWTFGEAAVRAGLPLLRAGHSALDAAVAGARAVEDDPDVRSVGFGGLGDAAGNVTLDASVMVGSDLSCGGVAGVANIRHVADLARRVMERTPHVLLVGGGAQAFAIAEGFPLETLVTPASAADWLERRPKESHDTVTVLALDETGSLAGACSTSGLAHKLPGRVGDSPIQGAGLYVDDRAGAAGGTGVGEEILRIAGSFFITEQLRAGRSPQEACETAIHRILDTAQRRGRPPERVAFLALDPQGRHGAACTRGTNFPYCLGIEDKVSMLQAPELG